jgi:hypothetical protein
MKTKSNISKLKKAFGLPATDSSHQYIFRSGEYGPMYQYWYRDMSGNYYRYSNAPEGHQDHEPLMGSPLMDPEQPLPEKNPEFFSQEGFKRNRAIPTGKEAQRNPAYDQKSSSNIWFEVFQDKTPTYVYLDADIKENLDLYVQGQLRIVDANMPKFRMYSTELFKGTHPKDKVTGAMLFLVDQGYYSPEELCAATVGDIEFIDQTVRLLGRKLVCDLAFYDFLTSIAFDRGPHEPLFQYETVHGTLPVGLNYLYAVFYSVRMSPKFLLNWNASHLFSRIVNRMHFQGVPAEEVEESALDELSRTLTTREDVKYLVDYKLRVALMRSYETSIGKSLTHLITDDFGIMIIRSDLTSLREDEKDFSTWLQAEPMHDTSPAEEAQVEQALQPEEPAPEGSEGATDPEQGKETPPDEIEGGSNLNATPSDEVEV